MKKLTYLLLLLSPIISAQTNIIGGSGISKVATLTNLKTSTALSSTTLDIGRFYMVMADSGLYVQRGTQVHRINRIKSTNAPLFFDGIVINTNVDWEDSNGNIWYADPKGYNAWVMKPTQMLKANFPLPYTVATGSSSATIIPYITNSIDSIPYIAKGSTGTGFVYEPLIPPRSSYLTQSYSQTLSSGAKVITRNIRDTLIALTGKENLLVYGTLKSGSYQPVSQLTIVDYGATLGSADNAIFIQRAVTFGTVDGSPDGFSNPFNTVVIPDGIYTTSKIILNSLYPLKMVGSGTLKLKNSTNFSLVEITSNNITIDGVTFDGNSTNQSTNVDGLGACVYNDVYNNVTIKNNTFKNCRRSAIFQSGAGINNIIKDNIIENSLAYGIQIESNAKNIICDGNTIKNCQINGIRMQTNNISYY